LLRITHGRKVIKIQILISLYKTYVAYFN